MYVRTILADLIPGREREAVRIFRDQVVPAIREQAGYLATAMYVDHRTHQAQTVSFWETKQAAEATAEGSDYLHTVLGMLSSCIVTRDMAQWEVAHLDVAESAHIPRNP